MGVARYLAHACVYDVTTLPGSKPKGNVSKELFEQKLDDGQLIKIDQIKIGK